MYIRVVPLCTASQQFDGFEIIGRKSIQQGISSILSCLSDEYLIKRITYLIIKHPLLLIIWIICHNVYAQW